MIPALDTTFLERYSQFGVPELLRTSLDFENRVRSRSRNSVPSLQDAHVFDIAIPSVAGVLLAAESTTCTSTSS